MNESSEILFKHGNEQKKIVLFDVSVGSMNLGDYIIMESIYQQIRSILNSGYILNMPTHLTPFNFIQIQRDFRANWVKKSDVKFICGTDLITSSMFHTINQLNVHLWTCSPLCNSVLLGVGNSWHKEKSNLYTKLIYNKIFSREFLHSVRDRETQATLKSFGFDSIVTGCPTLWGITPELCRDIPKEKSDSVVFTLTGSNPDEQKDYEMIQILKKNYKKVYFWIQTAWDYEYFRTIPDTKDIKIILPDLSAYGEFLSNYDVDYVGTRLHGGIYAIQHKKRAVIIAIDSRSRDMAKVNNFNLLERDSVGELNKIINGNFETNIYVDFDAVDKWKNQF